MAHVFISFIHEEELVATAVHDVLQGILPIEHGVFLSADNNQILAGEIWLDKIRDELTEAKVLVLMLSPTSVQRPWINFEAGAAWLAEKAIIPVCFGGLTKSTMPKPYSGIQALDLPGDLDYLVQSVRGHLDPYQLTTSHCFDDSRAYKTVAAALVGERYAPKYGEPWDSVWTRIPATPTPAAPAK